MAGSNDLIKYITERVVTYMETPKEERKHRKQIQEKPPWTVRWFGMIPFSVSLWKEDITSRKSKKRRS